MEYPHSVRALSCLEHSSSDSSSRTCIHKYSASNILSGSAASTSNPIITCLVQSPAIDVVGIGFASGEISVYDIRADERLMRVFMQEGSIRSLAFRNGTSRFGAPVSILKDRDICFVSSREPRWYAGPFCCRFDWAHRILGPQLGWKAFACNPRSPRRHSNRN